MASSVIRRFVYDATKQELVVELMSGSVYVYEDVPRETYDAFLAAPSKGAFYNAQVRDEFYHRPLSP
ncbi:MAG: KTSC domain-containing protein [Hyphomonadaceae bacterium]|nr:KTSC domain-containing protein [Hyphomonadaceae bacterium]